MTFCADFNRFVKWCEASNADPGYNNFQSFVSAMLDTVIVAQQFCTIAEMRGFGCCYLGTTTWNAPKIAEALALPELVVPVITVTLGYPEGETQVSDRLPVEAIMHTERYKEYDAEAIHAFYTYKEALDENRRFVEANEHFSAVFLEFLAAQGYMSRS